MSLYECLNIMDDTSRPFDIEFVSYDKNRKEVGGEIIKLSNCVKSGSSHNRKDNDTVVVSRTDRKQHPYPIHLHLIIGFNGQEIYI